MSYSKGCINRCLLIWINNYILIALLIYLASFDICRTKVNSKMRNEFPYFKLLNTKST